MASDLIAIAILILVLVAWVSVQMAWKRSFPGVSTDPDILAGRMGCSHGCDCQDDDKGDPDCCDKSSGSCHREDNLPESIEEETS